MVQFLNCDAVNDCPKISIIVPVYNAEESLSGCIESIVCQSYANFELLLVDDGSMDLSGIICDEYSKIDKRIRVFHKQNGGVSSARNMGLKNAVGEWVTFVDADDKVKVDYLKNLLSHTDTIIDLVVSYAEVYGNQFYRKEVYPSKLVTNHNFESIFIENDMHWHTSPWSKLFRMEIIRKNNLLFCEGMHICEDALFIFSFMALVHTFYISNDTDYIYYIGRGNSLTNRINSVKSELLTCKNIKNVVCRLIEEKKIKHPVALANLNWLIASNTRRVINALYYNKTSRSRRIRILRTIDIDTYVRYIGKHSIKEEILKMLLYYKLIHVYDAIRVLAALRNRYFFSI